MSEGAADAAPKKIKLIYKPKAASSQPQLIKEEEENSSYQGIGGREGGSVGSSQHGGPSAPPRAMKVKFKVKPEVSERSRSEGWGAGSEGGSWATSGGVGDYPEDSQGGAVSGGGSGGGGGASGPRPKRKRTAKSKKDEDYDYEDGALFGAEGRCVDPGCPDEFTNVYPSLPESLPHILSNNDLVNTLIQDNKISSKARH